MKKPAYYVAVFGKPEPPVKDTVDSGAFFLGIRGADTPGDRGDILLLYSASGPAGSAMHAPGIGIVLTKTREYIYYRYLPFASPISKETLEITLTEDDRKKFSEVGSKNYWILAISDDSFRNATRDASIAWP